MATIGRVAVYAVLALIRVTPVAAQLATPEAAIRAQVQGFYHDDRDNRWPDVLDHFWVGKITLAGRRRRLPGRGLPRVRLIAIQRAWPGKITYSRCLSR